MVRSKPLKNTVIKTRQQDGMVTCPFTGSIETDGQKKYIWIDCTSSWVHQQKTCDQLLLQYRKNTDMA